MFVCECIVLYPLKASEQLHSLVKLCVSGIFRHERLTNTLQAHGTVELICVHACLAAVVTRVVVKRKVFKAHFLKS